MASRKKLNIAMVGYGFMAGRIRTRLPGSTEFFDVGYEPVLRC